MGKRGENSIGQWELNKSQWDKYKIRWKYIRIST